MLLSVCQGSNAGTVSGGWQGAHGGQTTAGENLFRLKHAQVSLLALRELKYDYSFPLALSLLWHHVFPSLGGMSPSLGPVYLGTIYHLHLLS